MGKKELSKGREWERGRRDILNQTFQKLREALPDYSTGVSLSKKTILTEALAYIRRLEQERQELKHGSNSDVLELQIWVRDILQRQAQLLGLLKNTGINPPANLLSIQHPPKWVEKFSPALVGQISRQGESQVQDKTKHSSKKVSKKKTKDTEKTKENHLSEPTKSTSNSISTSKSSSRTKLPQQDGLKKNYLPTTTSVPFVPNNSVVVQSAPMQLPPQLLFASGTSNATMPLLVSVTGVKQVNPVILVQSNGITSPLASQNAQNGYGNPMSRPIRPGLQTRAPGKVRKIAIPSLKTKSFACLVRSSSKVTPKKGMKSGTGVSNKSLKSTKLSVQTKKNVIEEPSVKVNTDDDRTNKNLNEAHQKDFKRPEVKNCIRKCGGSNTVCNEHQKSKGNLVNQKSTIESIISKGNVSAESMLTANSADDSSLSNFTTKNTGSSGYFSSMDSSATTEEGTFARGNDESARGRISAQTESSESVPNQDNDSRSPVVKIVSVSGLSKRHAMPDSSAEGCLAEKCARLDPGRNSEDSSQSVGCSNVINTTQSCDETAATVSPSKALKGSYSISALCSQQQQQQQQQLMHQSEISEHASQVLENNQHQVQQHELLQNNNQAVQDEVQEQQSAGEGLNVTSELENVNRVQGVSLPPADQFLDWAEKGRSKSDRLYPSLSPFSNGIVHNSKNTFVPISDIGNYKTIPEVFDAAEGTFGLHTSDISGDLFASLQVPPGAHHPESISPTAAFLLAFPLVSTSKASELLTEEAVCENNDSQPGMKTILQIGNLDSDTPVTKCVSGFSSNTAGSSSSGFSASSSHPQANQSATMSKGKRVINGSSDNINSFVQKDDETVIVQSKSNVSGGHTEKVSISYRDNTVVEPLETKDISVTVLKDTQACLSKSDQPLNGLDGKQTHCQSRNSALPSLLEMHPSRQMNESDPKEKSGNKAVASLCVIPTSSASKSMVSNSTSHCDKRASWSSSQNSTHVIHSQNPFSDFPTSTNTQSDCVHNLPSLPVLVSSADSLDKSTHSSDPVTLPVSSFSVAQNSSCASIVSWSTLPSTENSSTKLAHFHDMFPTPKGSDKLSTPELTSLYSTLPHYSHMPPTSSSDMSVTPGTSGNLSGDPKMLSTASHLNPNISVVSKLPGNEVSHRTFPDHKNSAHIGNFNNSVITSKHSTPVSAYNITVKPADSNKKHYTITTEPKQNSSMIDYGQAMQGKEMVPTSSIQHYSLHAPDSKPVPPHSSSSSSYHHKSSEMKQKGIPHFTSDHVASSKLGSSLLVCNQSSFTDGKVYSQVSASNQKVSFNTKQTLPQNTGMMLYNNHETSVGSKPHNTSNHYNHPSVVGAGLKKGTSHFSHSGVTLSELGKQDTVMTHFSSGDGAPIPHYNASTSDGQGHHIKHPEQHTQLKTYQQTQISHQTHQQHHQQQQLHNQHLHHTNQHSQQVQQSQFPRSNPKESTTNLHRPPVNWMTAPDIRSHQHHNGPAFGNNNPNTSSTQCMLYLPDHMKDTDSAASSIFDQSGTFHCLDMPHGGQSIYKGNELQLFGNDTLENINESNAWSPNKAGNSSMLANMLIPSTLPTLVGDLALGDNSISRPFLPTFSNEQPCSKKPVKRQSSKRGEKAVEDSSGTQNIECTGSFLSVSQLVDPGNTSKNRATLSGKESGPCYSIPFPDQDSSVCHPTSKQNLSKPISSNYSTEALLSTSSAQQNNQHLFRKRRTSASVHYTNNYAAPGAVPELSSFHSGNSTNSQVQVSQSQCSFLSNEYQGTFLHSDSVPPFMLPAPTRSAHRNVSYPENMSERNANEDSTDTRRPVVSTSSDVVSTPNNAVRSSSGRQRTSAVNSSNGGSSSALVPGSSNLMDFGYINMTPSLLSDDLSFTNHHPPHPPFLPHHSYAVPSSQDTLYSAPRLPVHSHHSHPQNNSVHSPSATTLTNFHLSTIFPEINEKVVC